MPASGCFMTEAIQVDESIYTESGSTSSAKAVVNDRSKGYILGTLLALSILTNIGCFWAINNDAKEQRLKQYDLDDFKSRGFADLKGEVAMHDKLITAFMGCKR